MSMISPFLWFDGTAVEAATFYASVFPNSAVTSSSPMGVSFTLDGLEFQGLNAGPQFPFTEAISFFVKADTQELIDHYWAALLADGGEESQCGWLKDRFGLSWQIVPPRLAELLGGSDPEGAARALAAMMGMRKIVIAELEAAYAGQQPA